MTGLPGRPSGVVFDCDGLLVDTEPSWGRAEAAMFTRRGLVYTEAQRHQFIGISATASIALMGRAFGESDLAAIHEELLSDVVALISVEAQAMPGAVDLVAAVRSSGVPCSVASNSPRAVVEQSLAIAGLSFDTITSVEDVVNPKPDPEIYRLSCQRLEIDPARAVGFEDSLTGLAAARGAGLFVVGVPSLAGEFEADLVVGSLADTQLLDWVSSW